MGPYWLMLTLCISTLMANTYSVPFPNLNEYIAATGGRSRRAVASTDKSSAYPNGPIKIKHMRVRSEIALRYARTLVTTIVQNRGRRPQEYAFNMLLPETAFITRFTMVLGGKRYKAFVKVKDEAKKIYTDAVSQGVGAAHVATEARDSNHFTVTVNVEGNSTAAFLLRYEEFLVRRNGVYNYAVNLHPGAIVKKMKVIVHIKESQKIIKLRVPEVRTGNEVDATEKDAQNTKVDIKKRGTKEREVTITFTPDQAEQKRLAEIYVEKTKEKSPSDKYIGYNSEEDENEESSKILGQFVVQYDVERSNDGEMLVNDGYFVHFLAPSSLTPLSKHVVFVLDTSDSMRGRKIDQLCNAMKAILSDLNPNDYFNIVEFNFGVKVRDLKEAARKPTFQEIYLSSNDVPVMVAPALATPENIAKGKIIVSRLSAYGGTNIYGALDVALNLTKGGVDNSEEIGSVHKEVEPVIIFLTDGDPTYGNTDVDSIISLITDKNSGEKQASLYSLAFGEEADRTFLRKLSLRNEGFMRHIYEAADAALQLHDFYRQVSSPLLSHIQFLYPSKQIKEGSLSRNQFRTINEGSEVAVVGQLAEGVSEMTPEVRGFYATENGFGRGAYELSPKVPVNNNSTKNKYLPLERLWAYLTIKQLLDKQDSSDNHSDDPDGPKKRALDIALKYSFVTPLTSLVVVRPIESKPVEGETDETKVKADETNVKADETKVEADETKVEADETRGEGNDDTDVFLPVAGPPGMRADDISEPGVQKARTFSVTDELTANAIHFSIGADYTDKKTIALLSSSNSRDRPGPKPGQNKGRPTWIPVEEDSRDRPGPKPGQNKGRPTWIPVEEDNPISFIGVSETVTVEGDPFHLAELSWTSSILDLIRSALKVTQEDGSLKYLKLTEDVNPPKRSEEDEKCSNGRSVSPGAADNSESVCVYITRCFAARNITVSIYQNSYCEVNDSYAGVCCPRNEVDKTA